MAEQHEHMNDPYADILTPKHPKPDWATWGHTEKATLWEAVALACDIEPTGLKDPFAGPAPEKFNSMKAAALASLPTSGLITPSDFIDHSRTTARSHWPTSATGHAR